MLTISQNRTKSKIPLIKNFAYPSWNTFTEENSSIVVNFGAKIEQVIWAAAGKSDQVEPAFTGIYIDGTSIIATNMFIAARLPVQVDSITEPVTIHAQTLADAIKADGDVRITPIHNGIGISPDPYTQIICRGFATNPAGRMPMKRDYQNVIEVNSEQMCRVIQRMLTIGKGDDNLSVLLVIEDEQIALTMSMGSSYTEDVIEIPGYAIDTPRRRMVFDPAILLASFSKTPTNTVKMYYDTDVKTKSVYITSGMYEAWFAQKEDKGDTIS